MASRKNKKYTPSKKSEAIKRGRGRPRKEPINGDKQGKNGKGSRIPPESEILSAEEILAKNKEIENSEQAEAKEEPVEFPDGVFETPPPSEPDATNEKENTQAFSNGKEPSPPKEPAKVDLKGKPFNLTICIDTFIGIICMFLFKNIDPTVLDMTSDELQYFSELEVKCGINFEIGSPWFYFGALGMCYMNKIKALFIINRLMKEEKEAEEKAKKEIEKKEDKKAD